MVKIILLILVVVSVACADTVNLQWDHDGVNTAGYTCIRLTPKNLRGQIYAGFDSTVTVDATQRTCSFTNISSHVGNYFIVTAFNASGDISAPSNTVSVFAPVSHQRGNIAGSVR